MSSSADFSDEDDYSVKSGSASPAPGDTLPWNLPRHERSKRKIHGGSVLDPAERAVLRIAGEQRSPCCPRQKQCANMVRLRSARWAHSDLLRLLVSLWFFISGHSLGVVLWICGACDGILVRSYSGYDALKCNHRAVGIGSHYRIFIPLLLWAISSHGHLKY